MSKKYDEIVKLLKSGLDFNLGMNLLISQIEYKRGIEILHDNSKTNLIGDELDLFFDIDTNKYYGFYHSLYDICLGTDKNALKVIPIKMAIFNSWDEFKSAIKKYQKK